MKNYLQSFVKKVTMSHSNQKPCESRLLNHDFYKATIAPPFVNHWIARGIPYNDLTRICQRSLTLILRLDSGFNNNFNDFNNPNEKENKISKKIFFRYTSNILQL